MNVVTLIEELHHARSDTALYLCDQAAATIAEQQKEIEHYKTESRYWFEKWNACFTYGIKYLEAQLYGGSTK